MPSPYSTDKPADRYEFATTQRFQKIDMPMDGGSEEVCAAFELRKRSQFVFGALTVAPAASSMVWWILIFMSIGTYASSAEAQGWILGPEQNNPAKLPVASLLDWSDANDAISSLTATESKLQPVLHVSPEVVFRVPHWAPKSSGCCELVAGDAFSASCTSTEELIPWSRWQDGRSAVEFAAHDFSTLLRNLDNDFLSLWELENVLFVGSGLGLSLGLRESVDEDVREYTARHPGRWGNFSDALVVLGNTETQIAGMSLLYGYAYHHRDDELMDFTRLMIRSYTMTGLSTLLIKGIANTDRPNARWNNGRFGFPSAHVSTSFAIAATMEEYYGPEAGIPAYLVAGMIGWSRIDERDHDLSDVVFGAVLGYAIAKSIAGQELRGDSRIRMCPWMEPGNRTVGAIWEIDF